MKPIGCFPPAPIEECTPACSVRIVTGSLLHRVRNKTLYSEPVSTADGQFGLSFPQYHSIRVENIPI
jgi:hypothetical protein